MREKLIEEKLKKEVAKRCGKAVKFFPAFFAGFPDRMVLVPMGRIWFVEVKKPGEQPTYLQKAVMRWLTKTGFKTRVVDSLESISEFLNEIDNEK
jgi:hypothetical protein